MTSRNSGDPGITKAVDARDRGFTLGDGVFETLKLRRGRPLRWEAHMDRLSSGLDYLGIVPPRVDDLRARITLDWDKNGRPDTAAARISVSRGVIPTRGLDAGAVTDPTIIVTVDPFSGYPKTAYENGLSIVFSRIRRNEHSPLSGIKALSYLDQVLARREATAQGADEALMLNTAGMVVCSAAGNLFAVVAHELVTPPLSDGVLAGTIRGWILNCRDQLAVSERSLTPDDLSVADELFLTNSLMGIMPVATLDSAPVGAGRPGPITTRLNVLLAADEETEAG